MAGNRPQSDQRIVLAENTGRLPRFQTRTVIAQEGSTRKVYKYAVNEHALPFLEDIIMREMANREYFREAFRVLSGTLQRERIEYEYVPFPSLLDIMTNHLRRKRFSEADDVFKSYVKRVQSLQQVRVFPEDFVGFVVDGSCCRESEMLCLRRGVLDLIPRNIVLAHEEWVVLDNEWSFDFPIPQVFVLFRAIRDTSIALQNEIRAAASKEVPVVNLLAHGTHDIYVPRKWIGYMESESTSLRQMLRWECGFQRYVVGEDYVSSGRVKRFPKTRIKVPIWHQERCGRSATAISRLIKRLPRMKRYAR